MPQRNKDELFNEVRVLSQQIARKDRFLAATACMNEEERELYAILVIYRMLTKDNSLKEFEPIIKILGKARWGRTELTDLGLRLGENVKVEDF